MTVLGFERFGNAEITTVGTELMHCIRKGPFRLCKLRRKDASAPAAWNAVPATRQDMEGTALASLWLQASG